MSNYDSQKLAPEGVLRAIETASNVADERSQTDKNPDDLVGSKELLPGAPSNAAAKSIAMLKSYINVELPENILSVPVSLVLEGFAIFFSVLKVSTSLTLPSAS